jgi:lipase
VVCLHGVTAWGGHFRRLAEDGLGGRFAVEAPDLLGHGSSPHEPPWRIEAHVEALLATLDAHRAVWVGHSFGARLAVEVCALAPDRVEGLVLLDPALHLPPHVALFAAESARAERSYATIEEAIERRYVESALERAPQELLEEELPAHLVRGDDGRWRYRYAQASVVTAHAELATAPPPFSTVRVPTLVVLGADSYLPYDAFLDDHRAALGELLLVTVVPGGHTVLWDAFDETAAAVQGFLESPGSSRRPPLRAVD